MSDPVTEAAAEFSRASYLSISALDLSFIATIKSGSSLGSPGGHEAHLYVGSLGGRESGDYGPVVEDVILLHEPRVPWTRTAGVRVAQFPFADGPGPIRVEDQRVIDLAVSYLEEALRAGHRVAVLCRYGRNRSCLVTALALRRLWTTVPSRPIVDLLRSKRGSASLSNPYFRRLIEATDRASSGVHRRW